MKKELLIILLVSLLPFVFIFSNPTFFYTQDGWTHLARGGAFYKALLDGQFPVRWAGDLNYAYGMPLFDYVFHMPYLVMSVFIFLGAGLVNALKITTLISFIFSGIFMYLFAREFFKDSQKAFFVTLFYQFFPYHLVDMFVRGSIGEAFAFTFFPLILYGAVLFFRTSSYPALVYIALGTAGVVLSHLATGLAFLLICGVFILLFAEKIKQSIFALLGMILGLGVSAYYWVPALLDHKYTYGSLFAKDLYTQHFVPFLHFFLPNFFNDPGVRIGNVPIHIGLFHSLSIVAALWMLFGIKKIKSFDKKLIIFCLAILLGAFFIMQPVSLFFWQHIPLMEQFQFPWRFLGSVGFATSLLAGYFLTLPVLKKKIFAIGLLVLVVVSTAWYWYPQLGFRTIKEAYYWNYPLDTTYFGETNLVWSAGPAKAYPKMPVEVIGGKAKISEIKKKSNLHTYTIDAATQARIVDHIQYFPGWKVLVNGQEVPVQFQDPSHRGEITYVIPQGTNTIKVVFGETKTRLIADIFSVVTFVFLALLFVLKFVMPNLFRHLRVLVSSYWVKKLVWFKG